MNDWTTSHDRVLAQRNAEGWMFLIEAARDLRTTGAVAPSGKALARALTDPVRAQAPARWPSWRPVPAPARSPAP